MRVTNDYVISRRWRIMMSCRSTIRFITFFGQLLQFRFFSPKVPSKPMDHTPIAFARCDRVEGWEYYKDDRSNCFLRRERGTTDRVQVVSITTMQHRSDVASSSLQTSQTQYDPHVRRGVRVQFDPGASK
jgi:hypothetical protein